CIKEERIRAPQCVTRENCTRRQALWATHRELAFGVARWRSLGAAQVQEIETLGDRAQELDRGLELVNLGIVDGRQRAEQIVYVESFDMDADGVSRGRDRDAGNARVLWIDGARDVPTAFELRQSAGHHAWL